MTDSCNTCPECNGQSKSIAGSSPSYDGWQCLDCGYCYDETGAGTEPMPAEFEVGMMYGGGFFSANGITPVAFLVKGVSKGKGLLHVVGGWGCTPVEHYPVLGTGPAEYIILTNGIKIWAHSSLKQGRKWIQKKK